MAKEKLKYGKKNVLPKGSFDLKKCKVKISLLLDGDLLEAYKTAALSSSHGEYQTLMKEKLREALFGKQIDATLREVIRQTVVEEMKKVS